MHNRNAQPKCWTVTRLRSLAKVIASHSALAAVVGLTGAASAATPECPASSGRDGVCRSVVGRDAHDTVLASAGGGLKPAEGGITAAPGGSGAYVGLNITGSGHDIDTVWVNYFPGLRLPRGKATAEVFEVSWYEGGVRRVEHKGPESGWLRATQSWNLERRVDAAPICGRVQADGEWSGYVCVTDGDW